MASEFAYRCTGDILLRVPLLPREGVRRTWSAPHGPSARNSDDLIAYIGSVVSDPAFREAVEVASHSLASRVDRILTGEPHSVRTLARTAGSLTRYLLRASSRPTPFGLFAGVAPAGFGDSAKAVLGSRHRKGVRPDRGWLSAQVARWEKDSDVAEHLHVVANGLCRTRRDRIVLPFATRPAGRTGAAAGPVARTLRLTPVVDAALRHAGRPVPLAKLENLLEQDFPDSPPGAVRTLLTKLVQAQVLLTDARPPLDAEDPLGHLLGLLPADRPAPAREEIDTLRASLAAYRGKAVGEGAEAWRRIAEDTGDPSAVHVDLALDADVTLPQCVARELEAVADALWRMSPATQYQPLADYHAAFLERFGTGRLVPLQDLLDPDAGLGAPAGYRMPAGDRGGYSGDALDPDARREREQLLFRVVSEALAQRKTEVLLDDDLLRRFSESGPAADEISPPSLELFAQLVSPSTEAMEQGDFTLVLSPVAATTRAGSTFARFSYLFPGSMGIGETVRSVPAARPGVLPVQLNYQASQERHANVVQVPRWLDHQIAIGVYADPGTGTLGLDDIAVTADARRFRIISRSLGREISPQAFHVLNREQCAPNAARFLEEAVAFDRRRWTAWNWGSLAGAPFLPAIRMGRVVLSPAQWSFDRPGLLDPEKDSEEWEAEFAEWSAQWRVPRTVQVVVDDQRIPLDLTVAAHRALLRRTAGGKIVRLQAAPAGDDVDGGWLRGEGGAHDAEIVVALTADTERRTPAVAAVRDTAPPPPVRRAGEGEHAPGGSWLYARLYSSGARQDELLTRRLAPLLTRPPAGTKPGFFIRYLDPDPHLRLRFQGEPAVLNGELLPRLHDLCESLREDGLARGLVIDGYAPEEERYGGPEAMPLAEDVFRADTAFVLSRLGERPAGGEDLLSVAEDIAFMIRAFHGPYDGNWPAWVTKTYAKHLRHHQAFTACRADALRRITPGGGGPADDARSHGIGRALGHYGARLREIAGEQTWVEPDRILASVLHMHCNRRLGTDLEAEAKVYAIVRGAVQAHLDRRRAAGDH